MEELELSDPRALHALAHPSRIAILDLLFDREAATATDCASLLGESVQSCAYHLRTLAKWGLVEETTGSDGRARPWKLRASGFSVPKPTEPTPQFKAAWAALRGQVVELGLDVLRDFLEDEDAFRPDQRRAATIRNRALHGTPEELERLADDVSALLARYAQPQKAMRPEGAERMHAVFWLIPRRDSDGGR